MESQLKDLAKVVKVAEDEVRVSEDAKERARVKVKEKEYQDHPVG